MKSKARKGATMWKSGKILKVIGKKKKELVKVLEKYRKRFAKLKDVFCELKPGEDRGDLVCE